MLKNYEIVLLLFILLSGIFLRITGIKWGLISTKYFHGHSYHPDEQYIIESIRKINPSKFNFKPEGLVVWSKGVLTSYIVGLNLYLLKTIGMVKITSDYNYYKENPEELNNIYVSSRAVNIFFASLSIILIYFTGKELYGKTVGLLSAFFLSIVPVHVVNSHYIATDIIGCFWIMLVFYISYRIINNPDIKYFIFAGLLVGISAATKYNLAISIFIPVCAYLINLYQKRKCNYKAIATLSVICGISSIIGFFIMHPYSLISFNEFKEGINFTRETLKLKNATPETSPFTPVLLFYLKDGFLYGTGKAFYILSLAGLIFTIFKPENKSILILIWIVIWFFILSIQTWKIVRWIIPVIPFLCLLNARLITETLRKSRLKYITIFLLISISLYTFCYSYSYVNLMREKDTRDISSEWIEKNIPEKSKIGICSPAFAWDPSIIQMLYWYKKDKILSKKIPDYNLIILNNSSYLLNKFKPDYIVMNEYYYFPITMKTKYVEPEKNNLLKNILKNYSLIKEFEREISFYGIKFVKKPYPHDWRYVCPTIRIYVKNEKNFSR